MARVTMVVERDVERLRGEFVAMPGLRLAVPQAARLLSVGVADATAMLASLEDEGFLLRQGDGAYRRASPPLA